ncbi:hypothetical protein SAMN04488003_10918 [Loktanella fryxellensis]|uniref:Uncharacterized protein n=2 Tax=Loktanella fryxellensis TaxID=245187 RepID=A0A1H8DRK0_9RHOB|nr:hypothetical protein SAMN04488003_10918 [Loktanella fryxellensis]
MRGALALLMLSASPVLAADTFALPQGCEAFVTIQSRSCAVEHHFVCAADPEGIKRRASLSEDGMTYLGSTDREGQWVTSFYPELGDEETLEAAPADPASLTELLANGVDTYDFQTLSDTVGTTRYVGQDRLTGTTETIDGITLQQTEYNIRAYGPDGTEIWSSAGREYVSDRWRLFIGGTGRVTVPTETFDKDDRPVEFIFPGEPGFLSANPKHDCGAMLSSAPSDLMPKEIAHDHL